MESSNLPSRRSGGPPETPGQDSASAFAEQIIAAAQESPSWLRNDARELEALASASKALIDSGGLDEAQKQEVLDGMIDDVRSFRRLIATRRAIRLQADSDLNRHERLTDDLARSGYRRLLGLSVIAIPASFIVGVVWHNEELVGGSLVVLAVGTVTTVIRSRMGKRRGGRAAAS